jgi:fatty acid synthase subunit beta, fungi type
MQNLHTLSIVMNRMAKAPEASTLIAEAIWGEDTTSNKLREYIKTCLAETSKLPKPIELERGIATIPLKGIDVPFHSSLLRPGVQSYRKFLQRRIVEEGIQPEKLVGKWVPNVMAERFSLERSYIEEAFRLTQSPELKELLEQDLENAV